MLPLLPGGGITKSHGDKRKEARATIEDWAASRRRLCAREWSTVIQDSDRSRGSLADPGGRSPCALIQAFLSSLMLALGLPSGLHLGEFIVHHSSSIIHIGTGRSFCLLTGQLRSSSPQDVLQNEDFPLLDRQWFELRQNRHSSPLPSHHSALCEM